MTYEELVERVRAVTKRTQVSKAVGHVAFQFNIVGEAEGAFYVELSGGKINVEPYEYYDKDVLIVTNADVVVRMLEGKLQSRAAYSDGLMQVHGDVGQLEILPFGGR